MNFYKLFIKTLYGKILSSFREPGQFQKPEQTNMSTDLEGLRYTLVLC